MRIPDITRHWAYNNYCTYLSSHLLEAPRKYVRHGLVPGLHWAPFWPLPLSMHLVITPTQYLAVDYGGSGFTPNAFLLSGWLLTNVQVNNITTLYAICAHMYIHHIGITILLSTHLPFFLAGWLTPAHPVRYNCCNFFGSKLDILRVHSRWNFFNFYNRYWDLCPSWKNLHNKF